MEPLFAAVAHGCQAGRHQEAYADVSDERIIRKNEYYILKKLGSFGSYIAVISNFFNMPWSEPTSKLNVNTSGEVSSQAGFALLALGRLREAARPMQAGMDDSIDKKDWKGAAIDASNLSQLYLTLGEVKKAVDFAIYC